MTDVSIDRYIETNMDYLWSFFGYQNNELNVKQSDENRAEIDCYKRELVKLEKQRELLHTELTHVTEREISQKQVLDVIRKYDQIMSILLDELRFLGKIKKRENNPEELNVIAVRINEIQTNANVIKMLVSSYERML